MVQVLIQMGLLILCGAAWRIIRPAGLEAEVTRRVLTTLVFNLLLPALVLGALWEADVGMDSLRYSLFGATVVLFGALIAWIITKSGRVSRARSGPAMLGIMFGNVTFMGLPILEHLYGPWARSIVIHLDVFASTPLILTLGLLIARHNGTPPEFEGPLLRPLLINPPLWSGIVALILNLSGIPKPHWVDTMLQPLANAVPPLMLISVGLSLQWNAWHRHNFALGLAMLTGKMLLLPAFGLWLGWILGFRGNTLTALVLESGMPSMLFGIVYCDRYKLDGSFYAFAVLLTTLCATLTLPFWHHFLSSL